jgi:hypothetical protein
MQPIIRASLLAGAFAVTAAGAIAGLTLRAETKEASRAEACAHQTWPMISAACLDGGYGVDVRFVSTDAITPTEGYALRTVAVAQ